MSKESPVTNAAGIPTDVGLPPIPQLAYDLILESEGIDQPHIFPGGDSGVSLGRGYDLSAETRMELFRDWAGWLPNDVLERLGAAVGKSGPAAQATCANFRDIRITAEMADDVFYSWTVSKYYAQTKSAFPGVEKLPGAAQGALLSLVFNRGTSMSGDRRTEMRAIRDILSNGDAASDWPRLQSGIAGQLRSMKRVWANTDLTGLVTRREKEAQLVESATVQA
jgi:GH24 family phage-related lysozyme (muramidase)